jgi:hypothetical protein
MKKLILAVLAGCVAIGAQTGTQIVNQSGGPPPQPIIGLLFYDVSNNLQYSCKALQIQPQTTVFSIAAATLTNISVASTVATATTASAHKLYVGARLVVTGSATSAVNGTYSVTSVGTTTLVFTTTAADGTYTDAALKIATQQPQTSAAVWAIEIFTNPSNLLSSYYWALPNGAPAPGSAPPMNAKCDDRSKY